MHQQLLPFLFCDGSYCYSWLVFEHEVFLIFLKQFAVNIEHSVDFEMLCKYNILLVFTPAYEEADVEDSLTCRYS